MTNSKRAIVKVEDMKGLKMRVPPDATLVDILDRRWARESQQIKFAELYVAFRQGVVDGQENPLDEHPTPASSTRCRSTSR